MRMQTRRGFLKKLGFVAGSMVVSQATLGLGQSARKPNIVFILTDDQGSIDVNCYGSKDLYTPNMDRLAKEGTRFTQFYVGSPVCSPSRASLLTGRCPQKAGVPDNVGDKLGLPPEEVTIAEMCKAGGYRTGLFGKWHLGERSELSPNAQGFDEFLGHKVGCIDNYSHFFYWYGPNRHDLWHNEEEYWQDGSYFPDMIAKESCQFIEENKDQPFFLYAAFNMPHYPLQGVEKYRKMYSELQEPRKAYAVFLSTLDEKIGQIVNKIDELGLREDTLIIFMSDHGHSMEERNNFGGGNSGPFRGNKFTLWEGGIRVPCIVSWPGHIPQDAVRDQVAISTDWLPTIANYCQLKLPKQDLDGRNIVPVIVSDKAASPHKILCWQFAEQWAVRESDWKLVVNSRPGQRNGKQLPELKSEKIFLSNMAEDVTESKNLADDHPEIVERLTKIYEQWKVSLRSK